MNAAEASAGSSPAPVRGFAWLVARECLRVAKLWTQTILAPIISSALFIVVFGLSLGDRIREIDGFAYDSYIVPGLVAMAMAQAAYSNNSSSIFQARSDRYINDVLAAPMRPWQMHLGLAAGGWFRALAIGLGLVALAAPLAGAPIERPLLALAVAAILLALFGALGIVVGIYAESFDHHSFVNNLVILPLAFVGGVFYSVDSLDSPWQELSHANPLYYLVSAMRHGFLGDADAPLGLSLAISAAVAVALLAWAQYLFQTGRRLKP